MYIYVKVKYGEVTGVGNHKFQTLTLNYYLALAFFWFKEGKKFEQKKFNTIQFNTIQFNTIQFNTIPENGLTFVNNRIVTPWNTLPDTVVNAENTISFKIKLDDYLKHSPKPTK